LPFHRYTRGAPNILFSPKSFPAFSLREIVVAYLDNSIGWAEVEHRRPALKRYACCICIIAMET